MVDRTWIWFKNWHYFDVSFCLRQFLVATFCLYNDRLFQPDWVTSVAYGICPPTATVDTFRTNRKYGHALSFHVHNVKYTNLTL